MEILVSGGGIAGNALAFWLSKLGHSVTVVERFPTLRATGLQIDLRGHGVQVLKLMGLEHQYRAKLAPEQGMQLVDKTGRRRAYFPANKSGKGVQAFTTEWEIMRGDLVSIMYEETKTRANYVFGTSIESMEEVGHSVEVRFANGTSNRFDLVVGADGQWSRTRKMMLSSDTTDAGFYPCDGLCIGYFTVPRAIQYGEEYNATWYLATERRVVMTRRHSPEQIQAYLCFRSESDRLRKARKGDVKEEKEIVTDLFRRAGWQTEDLLRALQDADDFYLERLGLVKLDSWSRGRIALVGDAAYCPSANAGMGVSASIVGAYVLAGEIGRHCGRGDVKPETEGDLKTADLEKALKSYEEKFRPFMDQVQEGVLEDKGNGMPSTAFGIAVTNALMGIASLLRLNVFGMFSREKVKGWELPVYEEMIRG